MARMVNSGEAPTPAPIKSGVGTNEMMGGATGQISRVILQRRSSRRQWRIFECIFMIILDALQLSLAFYLAYVIRYDVLKGNDVIAALHTQFGQDYANFLDASLLDVIPLQIWAIMVGGLILIFAWRRLYHLRLTGTWFRQVWIVISSATTGLALLMMYYYFFQEQTRSRLLIPFAWVTTIVVLSVGRLVVSGVVGMLYRMGLGETRLVVVGSGRLAKMVMQHITANPNLGYSIVGFLHDLNEQPGDFGRFKMLGTIDDIGQVIRAMQIDEVIIALPAEMNDQAIRSVKLCERLGTSFKLIPDLYELSLSRIDMDAIEGIPLIGIKQVSLNTWQRLVTRLVDIAVSAAILFIGSPIWLFLALIIKVTSAGPAIYRQARVGLNGQTFTMYKFRSMYRDADQRLAQLLAQNEAQGPLFKMKDDPRVTAIGKFLRRTSLDEIPQLISVLKGDMSLVGPRPAVPREVAMYEEWQRGRLAIKPGLTGLWQVRGRSDLSFDEGVLMDLYYIENWSLRLYIQILLRTIPAVLFSRGAY
jgi:exopolysaccharide biosynthesis polyprenyl glycosylphosphotransferase